MINKNILYNLNMTKFVYIIIIVKYYNKIFQILIEKPIPTKFENKNIYISCDENYILIKHISFICPKSYNNKYINIDSNYYKINELKCVNNNDLSMCDLFVKNTMYSSDIDNSLYNKLSNLYNDYIFITDIKENSWNIF